MNTAVFVLLGYISGSVLYARVFSRIFGKENMIENSKDKNPGTANAFMYGGFWCGAVTLICDLLKGFLPVFLYMQYIKPYPPMGAMAAALVLAAPVVGHTFSVFHKFRGGKGIAVTFGCLLGLFPRWKPFAALAVFFIFFSVILRITPHFYRTLAAYFSSLFCMVCFGDKLSVIIGFALITTAVCIRMFASSEEKEKMQVKLLWMY